MSARQSLDLGLVGNGSIAALVSGPGAPAAVALALSVVESALSLVEPVETGALIL